MAVAMSIQKIGDSIARIPGLQPSNCGQPTEEQTAEDYREAYELATAYVEENPASNICTIEADYRVKCWQADELPVKLEKADNNIICFWKESTLKVKYPTNFSF